MRQLLLFIGLLCASYSLSAQTVTVNATQFFTNDSIVFTWQVPGATFNSDDWVGIYEVGQVPGGPPSVQWDYIPDSTGSMTFSANINPGQYVAYLLCCNGYTILDSTVYFTVAAAPEVTSQQAAYAPGDSLRFDYFSPLYAADDWIGVYPVGVQPGPTPASVWDYIPDSMGTLGLPNSLPSGDYRAYLLCCNGYQKYDSVDFSVLGNASLAVEKPAYLRGDTMRFDYFLPVYDAFDWIGIYPTGVQPGTQGSTTWNYVADSAGTMAFGDSLPAGNWTAYLLCCDGYQKYDSVSFDVFEGPRLTANKTQYAPNEDMTFTYFSTPYDAFDWIGVYPEGVQPGTQGATTWDYLADQYGQMTFTDNLPEGNWVAYLLCCDGYQKYDSVAFSVAPDSSLMFVSSRQSEYYRGEAILIDYADSSYASDDWIGLWPAGETPQTGSAQVWTYLNASQGTLSFDSTPLDSGYYRAYMLCCGGTDVYAVSDSFRLTGGPGGGMLVLNGDIIPEAVPLVFAYEIPMMSADSTDWLGIFAAGARPDTAQPLAQIYLSADSGYLDVANTLAPGAYTAYTLCCNGADVYAAVNFTIADDQTPAFAVSQLTYDVDTGIVTFTYHSPNYEPTDWIGIYEPQHVPGATASTTWQYLPQDSGVMTFSVGNLFAGHWKSHLFCCDGYQIYATAEFDLVVADTATNDTMPDDSTVRIVNPAHAAIAIFPNPTRDWLNFTLPENEAPQALQLHDLTGRLVQEETFTANRRSVYVGSLPAGVYLLTLTTDHHTFRSRITVQK